MFLLWGLAIFQASIFSVFAYRGEPTWLLCLTAFCAGLNAAFVVCARAARRYT